MVCCETKKISCFSFLGIIVVVGFLLFSFVYLLRTNDEIRGQIKVNKEDIIDKNRSPSTFHSIMYSILYWISFTNNPSQIDNVIIETNITQINNNSNKIYYNIIMIILFNFF